MFEIKRDVPASPDSDSEYTNAVKRARTTTPMIKARDAIIPTVIRLEFARICN